MKKVLVIIALMTTILYPQLKELVIKPTENRGGIPIFRDYPDKMAVFFYSSFDNLKIVSSYGIDKIYERGGGVYIVIITPERQRLEVQSAGYKTEVIHIKEGAARDCLFYTVDPKKDTDAVQGVKELAVTIQATPADAKITVDGKEIKHDSPVFFALGIHMLKVEKAGFSSYSEEINVTTANTLFKVNLQAKDPVSVTINSSPQKAEIYIDGIIKGETKKGMFIFPGSYELRLNLSGYIQITEKIVVSKDEKSNNFSYNLVKNTGKLKIEVNPFNAIVKANKETISTNQELELSPGSYQIEAESKTYYPYKNTITIELGKTLTERIELKQKTGKLQFSINPTEAECILTQNGAQKYTWTGLKIITAIAEGSYELTAKATGYKTITKTVRITQSQTALEDIQMEAGSDVPENFLYVEGGTFNMGSNDDGSEEKPIHRVTVSSFYIGRTEVTVKEYEAYCQATGTSMPSQPSWGWNDTDPIVNVSWNDAAAYCKWAGGRLPTEVEWEYAARGGNQSAGYTYSGSNSIDAVAWYSSNSRSKAHQVGTKLPNELGIYDMSGNAWEWCSDWYGSYSSLQQTNPKGPATGSIRVLRGGSLRSGFSDCHSSNRNESYGPPNYSFYDLGFRCVRP